MGALVLWQSSSIELGLWVIAGSIALLLVLALISYIAAWLLRRSFYLPGLNWRVAVASLRRNPQRVVIQLVSVGVGIMSLMLLAFVRGDLLEAWRVSIPENAPNQFVINIQPDQLQEFHEFLGSEGITDTTVYPMIRGRLVAINGDEVSSESFEDARAQRMVQHDFNLSWSETLPDHNRIDRGEWWTAQSDVLALSLEKGIAETFNVTTGDKLTFTVAGEPFEAVVTNLREVEWESFQVNFFVIASPALLRDRPASHITSFYLPESKDDLPGTMLNRFPGITVFDVDALISQAQNLLAQASKAVEFMFLFTLLAGLAVLVAAVHADGRERIRDASLLRALGADRIRVRNAMLLEFGLLGGLSGSIAVIFAALAAFVVMTRILSFPYTFSPILALAGVVGAVLVAMAAGLPVARSAARRPPRQMLD